MKNLGADSDQKTQSTSFDHRFGYRTMSPVEKKGSWRHHKNCHRTHALGVMEAG
jgi:hypothetical protein